MDNNNKWFDGQYKYRYKSQKLALIKELPKPLRWVVVSIILLAPIITAIVFRGEIYSIAELIINPIKERISIQQSAPEDYSRTQVQLNVPKDTANNRP